MADLDLASVKYLLVVPSVILSVLLLNVTTPVVLLYAIDADAANPANVVTAVLIEERALDVVKYKLVVPSPTVSVLPWV